MSFINNVWYKGSLTGLGVSLALYPFSLIFKCVSSIRRSLYGAGIKKSYAPNIPVVVVGGITVGGSGKTPLCVALLKELKRHGYNPGLLSRGYKSQSKSFPLEIKEDTDSKISGDEPLLIKQQTGAITVIDPDRVRGAFYLKSLGVDIIVCDDGLQHYALSRDVEIAVLEGGRMLGNGMLLPSGPLREGKWRLGKVDAIVVNGAVARVGYFSMILKTSSILSLKDKSPCDIAKGSDVCALAGIGNPERFYKTLEDYGFRVKDKIDVGDHLKADIKKIRDMASRMPVIMTAKDAIKYTSESLDNVFVLNIEAQFSHIFYDHILKAIKDSDNKVSRRSAMNTDIKYNFEDKIQVKAQSDKSVSAQIDTHSSQTDNDGKAKLPEADKSTDSSEHKVLSEDKEDRR